MHYRKRIAAILVAFCVCLIPNTSKAEEPEMIKCMMTCYTATGNPTASGVMPRKGIMAAKKEWMGLTAIVYHRNDDDSLGDFIGYYEILDTGVGKDGAIKKGKVVDIYVDSKEEALPTQKIYLILVKAEG